MLKIEKSVNRIDAIRIKREAREKAAADVAATLPAGDYHAYNNTVVCNVTRQTVHTAAGHWDACLVLIALGNQSRAVLVA